jgi:hypothetical protein
VRRLLVIIAAGFLVLMTEQPNVAAQGSDQTIGRTAPTQSKAPLSLDEAQRQKVWQTVMERATDDKLPAGFQPVVRAKVPTQKKLPLHPLPRPLVNEIPALKQYYYAKLPDQVLLVDPMSRQVVDVITR